MTARPIPYTEAAKLAKAYGYDQVVIVARRTGIQGAEAVVPWGSSTQNKIAIDQIADRIRFSVLGFPR